MITCLAGRTIIDGRPVPAVCLHGSALVILGARRDGKPCPSVRDLIAVTKLTPNAVVCHLKRLMQLSLTAWEPGKARTLTAKCRAEVEPQRRNDQ